MKQHFAIKGQFTSMHQEAMSTASDARKLSGSPARLAGSGAKPAASLADRCAQDNIVEWKLC
jgi:hypothetical protein